MPIELDKKAETVQRVLLDKGLATAPTMRVAVAIDISYSMKDEFEDGSVQKVLDQLLGVAKTFDDDGAFDMWQFDDRTDYIGQASEADYGTYVRSKRLGVRGGTLYSPCLRDITSRMFGAAQTQTTTQKKGGFLGFGAKTVQQTANIGGSDEPVMVLFITDGAPQETISAVRAVLKDAQKHNIYFQMIGINNQGEEFELLSTLADELPNVGFVKMNGFRNTDEQLYRAMITDELVAWVSKFATSAAKPAVA
jgi:hypothetical protein